MCLICQFNFFPCYYLFFPLCLPEAQSKPSNAVMFLLNNSSCCKSFFQHLQSSSNAWEKGTVEGWGTVTSKKSFFPFVQKINLLPPTPSSFWTLWITCFFLGRWAKEAGWEASIYRSPPVYVPFLADVIELCTHAGRRENSGRNENWGKCSSFANA